MTIEEIDRSIDSWLMTHGSTNRDLNSLYHEMAKGAHPDIEGGSHETFVYLKYRIESLSRSSDEKLRGVARHHSVDISSSLVRDFGIGQVLEDRAMLYLALYRLCLAGIFSTALKDRNGFFQRIADDITICLSWCIKNHASLAKPISEYIDESIKRHKGGLGGISRSVSKPLISSIETFIVYQDSGRIVTQEICNDLLNECRQACETSDDSLENKQVLGIAKWIGSELNQPPVLFNHGF